MATVVGVADKAESVLAAVIKPAVDHVERRTEITAQDLLRVVEPAAVQGRTIILVLEELCSPLYLSLRLQVFGKRITGQEEKIPSVRLL